VSTKNYKFVKGQTKAVHAKSPDGTAHAVGIGNLRVLILPDGPNAWFAQGLEIDYGASGKTIDEAKKHFEIGLSGTIELHLRKYGNIEALLKRVRSKIWNEAQANGNNVVEFGQASFHSVTPENAYLLPYSGIDYYKPLAA
jgi:hypothetical protein